MERAGRAPGDELGGSGAAAAAAAIWGLLLLLLLAVHGDYLCNRHYDQQSLLPSWPCSTLPDRRPRKNTAFCERL